MADATELELQQRVRSYALRPFDLDRAGEPGWRAVLLSRSPADHVFVLAAHPSVLDRASLGLLARMLCAEYSAGAVSAPELPASSGGDDPAAARDMAAADDPGRRYWHAVLSEGSPLLGLPLDRARAAAAAREDRAETFVLSESMTTRIDRLALAAGTSPEAVLLAVYQALLVRYTAQESFVIGLPQPALDRAQPGTVVGPHARLAALHVDLSGALSFGAVLARTHEALRHGLAHGIAPALLDELGGRQARSPFQTVFTHTPVDELTGFFAPVEVPARLEGGLTMEPFYPGHCEHDVDLGLELFRHDGRIHGVLRYDGALLDGDTAVSLARSLVVLIDTATAEPERAITELGLLSDDERERPVIARGPASQSAERGFPALFAEQAARTPDAIAVRHGSAQRTYAELDRDAERRAAHLRAQGVGRDTVVALAMDRGIALLTDVVAVLKAGGAYLALDLSLPPARLATLLEESQAAGVLVSAAGEDVLAGVYARMQDAASAPWVIRTDLLLAREAPALAAGVAANAGDLAYVIFTSGSTGVPKGAMVEHRGMVNHMWAKIADTGMTAADVLAQTAPVSFVISNWQLLAPLLVGAQVCIVDDEIVRDPRRSLEHVASEGITVLQTVPSLLKLMVEQAEERGPARPALSRLRWLIPTGEALPPALCRRWLALYPGTPMLNSYGCSECSDDVAHHVIAAAPEPDVINMPIGRPVANTSLYILDARQRPVPAGVVGELWIGGANVGRGYTGDVERTRACFVSDLFAGDADARMYRTGDVARMRADGLVEYMGRADHQVKIRGVRVELGEIEAVLRDYPRVRDAVVIADKAAPGGTRLIAYVAGHQDELVAEALRGHLAERLPPAMVPAAFVVLERFPVNTNGKLDRRALPAPTYRSEAPVTAARNDVEAALCEIWSELLGVPQIAVDDDFFALGGHSLLAVELAVQVQRRFALDLPLSVLAARSRVADLAEYIVAAEGGAGNRRPAVAIVPASPAQQQEPFALTDLQQAYWLGHMGLGLPSAQQLPAIEYLEVEVADLDARRFEQAVQQVVERHPALRSSIRPDGRMQVLADVPRFSLGVVDLRGLPADEVADSIRAVRERFSHQARPTDGWPLFALQAHRMDEHRYRLHLGFPLILGDLQSIYVMYRDIERCYRDPATALEPIAISFRDCVEAMTEAHNPDAYARAEAYWRQRAATLPPAPELPLARPGMFEPRFVRRETSLPIGSWQRFQRLARAAGLTPALALCAAYAEVLTAFSRKPHFTLNVLYQNRPPLHPQVQEVIGNFGTTILLEVDNRDAASFRDRARRLQARLWQDIEHIEMSGVRVLRELAHTHGAQMATAMPVVFASGLDLGVATPMSTRLLGKPVVSALQTPHVWLDHQLEETDDGLGVWWDAMPEMFPEGLIDAMFDTYLRLLEQLAAGQGWDQAIPVALPPAQLAARAQANRTEAPARDALMHQRVFERVDERPHQPAVIEARGTWTYAQIHGHANRLARRLRAAGVKPNTLVAIVMQKGWEQVVAALAIQAAGAAYLPVDPTLPAERLRYLIEHGQATVALTQPWLEERLEWPELVQRIVVSEDALAGIDDERLAPVQRSSDLAYVIFTSGSTGVPKGVMIDHRGAVNTLIDMEDRFGVQPEDRVLMVSSLSFDLSVFDIFGVLAAGGTVVLPEPTHEREPAHWATLVSRYGVTVWNSVPALMQLLVEHAEQGDPGLLASLRLVMLSGDWIPVSLPDRVQQRAPGVRVVSLGGATEASIWSIYYPIERTDPSWQSIPYGKPLANQRFHVLNDALEPAPVWVTGELYIAGQGLARGYWGDAEKSAARFFVHPRTGERLYKTGDLGRYLPDGNIEFLGRADFQVKVQGYRIELGEIETRLEEHPDVTAAVVTAQGEQRGDKRLVAYVVAESGSLDPVALRDFLATKLPVYMVPSVFIALDRLPLTGNGKVDRNALPLPGQAVTRGARERVAPRSELEGLLAQIWRDILGIEIVGVHDDFFTDLGGHSFAAVRMMARISVETGHRLPLSVLFSNATIARLAEVLVAAPAEAAGAPWSPLVPIQPYGDGRAFFCVHPIGGNVLCYRALAEALGDQRPFHGLQARGFEEAQAPFATLDEMVASYVQALRSAQPEGPYLLGGWSLGGLIAFEMARLLTQQGAQVERLIFIDSALPAAWATHEQAARLLWFVRDLAHGARLPDELIAAVQAAPAGAQAGVLFERARQAGLIPGDVDRSRLHGLLRVFETNHALTATYAPVQAVPVPAVLLQASASVARDAAEHWRPWVASLQVEVISGDHYSMFASPSLERLALALRAHLDGRRSRTAERKDKSHGVQ